MQRFRGGLVLKAHRLLYHSTLGLRVIKKKKNFRVQVWELGVMVSREAARAAVGLNILALRCCRVQDSSSRVKDSSSRAAVGLKILALPG